MKKAIWIIIIAVLILGIYLIFTSTEGEKIVITDMENDQPTAAYPFSIHGDLDDDNDGLNNALEAIFGTDPNKNDTDEDGYTDGDEVKNGYDPLLGNNKKLTDKTLTNITQQYFVWAMQEKQDKSLELKKELIEEFLDTKFATPLSLPEISLDEIKLSDDDSKNAIENYLKKEDEIPLDRNFNYADMSRKIILGEDLSKEIESVRQSAVDSYDLIKNLDVPPKAISVHKKSLGIIKMLIVLINDLSKAQKDPVKMALNVRKGQELAKISETLQEEKINLLR